MVGRALQGLVLASPLVLMAACTTAEPPPRYGQPQGYAPQQGYGVPPQQGYGYPPQQGYGVPPQQQGYGYPPQQGYGAPPPGQWAPPSPQQPPPQPQPSAAPFPWWPQGLPSPGAVPIPGLPSVTPSLPGGAAQQCVDTINQYRQSLRLAPLERWAIAEPCASGQAQSDAQSKRPHGSFGRCGEMAQNVCPGWRGPAEQMTGPCLQSMWNEGPGADYSAHGHYLNMSSTRYTKVACGYHTAPDGQVWAVQDFQ